MERKEVLSSFVSHEHAVRLVLVYKSHAEWTAGGFAPAEFLRKVVEQVLRLRPHARVREIEVVEFHGH